MTNPKSSNSPGEIRRESGRLHFTKLLSYLLREVSHPEMAKLADWAMNEVGCLHTSQLSHIRNAKLRMLGVKSLDSLGLINQAAFFHREGQKQELKALNTATATPAVEEILTRYVPVTDPKDPSRPLNAGDMMLIYLGHLKLDLFTSMAVEVDWANVAANFQKWIGDAIDERGLDLRAASGLVKMNWTGSEAMATKFVLTLSAVDNFTAKELEECWPEISAVVGVILDETISEEDLLALVGQEVTNGDRPVAAV